MSHFVAYILQFQEIIVYKIPPGGGGGSIASLRSTQSGPNRRVSITHIDVQSLAQIQYTCIGSKPLVHVKKNNLATPMTDGQGQPVKTLRLRGRIA